MYSSIGYTIGWPTIPPYTLESKETKTATLECKEKDQKLRISGAKNVNKRKNRLTPVKLGSKIQDKKSNGWVGGFGREAPIVL